MLKAYNIPKSTYGSRKKAKMDSETNFNNCNQTSLSMGDSISFTVRFFARKNKISEKWIPTVAGEIFKKMMWTETYRLPIPLSVNDYYEPRYNSKTRHCYIQKSYKAKECCGLVCVGVYRNIKSTKQFQR